ncbi:hypothetical protein HYDPIDRAFT_120047 [Hydnomerulius pinastri MD-312]|uniref:Uncharacterized protein n=1 Tax=Hydnomerulius pinastri MD-312 TaxID=994086 RepID=A0A0C9VKL5_9AGAM|nr:hypothetical protein HYDPIDRAFT_120047 [Hydnomerulius pinastri MD-312]
MDETVWILPKLSRAIPGSSLFSGSGEISLDTLRHKLSLIGSVALWLTIPSEEATWLQLHTIWICTRI